MKKTKLIEFANQDGDTLRGILAYDNLRSASSAVMMGGFERSCTTEKKFKALADSLIAVGVPSLRFDHTGVGLSDGDFADISVSNLGGDLAAGAEALKKEIDYSRISFVSHSLPPCIMAEKDKRKLFDKIVMLAPALNQRDLLRFWFVVNGAKQTQPNLKITWNNYQEYFNEKLFQENGKKEQKMAKAHYVGPKYFTESQDKDYSKLIPDAPNILHVHGEYDQTVPPESLSTSFSNRIIVPKADHDIERPDFLKGWLEKTVKFIIS